MNAKSYWESRRFVEDAMLGLTQQADAAVEENTKLIRLLKAARKHVKNHHLPDDFLDTVEACKNIQVK